MSKTDKLITPFGEIKILIDGVSIPYHADKEEIIKEICPDLLGRYQITIKYVPDGKEHHIACIFDSTGSFKNSPESGENLECQAFYNENRFKMSIGIKCDISLFDGERSSGYYDYDVDYLYDYDADYLDNGMEYIIVHNTKTETYKFGIAWIDDVGFDDPINPDNDREVQTWYGADPALML